MYVGERAERAVDDVEAGFTQVYLVNINDKVIAQNIVASNSFNRLNFPNQLLGQPIFNLPDLDFLDSDLAAIGLANRAKHGPIRTLANKFHQTVISIDLRQIGLILLLLFHEQLLFGLIFCGRPGFFWIVVTSGGCNHYFLNYQIIYLN